MLNYFSNENLVDKNGPSATVSVKNWFALMCLSFFSLIPIIGFIISLVLYLNLAFRQDTAPSIANYLKATLIFAFIGMVLAFIIAGIAGIFMISSMPLFTNIN